MAWQGIEGHDAVVERFVAAQALGRIAGSYLFIGPPGIGKSTFAQKLAGSLLCRSTGKGLLPCNACSSCVQAKAGRHPDIDIVSKPEDRATIPLETFIGDADHRMREGLCWRLLLRPAMGSRKVAIILDADHLADEAANCLLKTLEEPPDGAVIVLVGTALERQLPTIRSRCQIVRFRPLASESIFSILKRETASQRDRDQLDNDDAQKKEPDNDSLLWACAQGSGGSLERARLLLDPMLAEFRGRLTALLSHRPMHGVALADETKLLLDAAGKEAPIRRARLRIVLESAIDFFRAALRDDLAGEPPCDQVLAELINAWTGGSEEAVVSLRHTLDALDAVNRNANLTIVVDAWTALLEQPRLTQTT